MSVMMLTLLLLLRKEEGDVVEEEQEADQQPQGVEEGLEVLVPGKWSHQLLHNRYDDPDNGNQLPAFVPNRLPGLHLIGPVVKAAMTRAVDFFQLFFTDLLLQQICDHTNVYGWEEIVKKPYYADRYGAWKESTPDEIAKLIALILYCELVTVSYFPCYWSTKTLYHGLWACSIMSRGRFKALMGMLHVVDPATR